MIQRKTNLFYTSGEDAKFITFSNYTEALTGTFLSTDNKMFPSRFLCFYLPTLAEITSSTTTILPDTGTEGGSIDEDETTNADKQGFVNHIISNYENKLAFLRDYKKANNEVTLELNTLDYLISSIKAFDPRADITFIGDITEQDYNGTFADTICTIKSSDKSLTNVLVTETDTDTDKVEYEYSTNYLYGWYNNVDDTENYIGPDSYKELKPVFDTDNFYNISNTYKSLDLTNSTNEPIKFNIIVPLFDIVDINYKTNSTIIEEQTEIDLLQTYNETNDYLLNVPMGIWFADDVIELKRDNNTGYSPSWSLVIASQFKAFPYMNSNVTEVSDTDTVGAYATFAEILVKQSQLTSIIMQYENKLTELHNKINELTSTISSIGTTANIDDLTKRMASIETSISNIYKTVNNINNTSKEDTDTPLQWKYTE